MKIVVLLALLSVGEAVDVVALLGRNVTLRCNYDVTPHGRLSVCWGRGQIPPMGCGTNLVTTDGFRVTEAADGYQLAGRLDEGDVSLTVLNVSTSHSGPYGCRVDIPGWFNDQRHNFNLIVETVAQTTSSAPVTMAPTSACSEEATPTSGQMTSATFSTSSFGGVTAEQDSSVVTVVLVCVLFGVVALVTAGGLVIITRRWTRLNKIPQQQQQQANSWAHFTSTSSSLHLHSRGSAVENIYQIDGGGEEGDYEFCP